GQPAQEVAFEVDVQRPVGGHVAASLSPRRQPAAVRSKLARVRQMLCQMYSRRGRTLSGARSIRSWSEARMFVKRSRKYAGSLLGVRTWSASGMSQAGPAVWTPSPAGRRVRISLSG